MLDIKDDDDSGLELVLNAGRRVERRRFLYFLYHLILAYKGKAGKQQVRLQRSLT